MRPYASDLRVAFLSPNQAETVKQCLEGDDELQPTKIDKTFEVDGPVLIVRFSADDLKLLRVAMSSFFDMLLVCTKTLMEFDDDPAVQG